MFGKAFASMYEGSMVGAGSHVFAVWNYVIAKQEPDRVVGSQVRLNPKLLAAIIGDSEERMREAIEFLCAADPESTTKCKNGARLVRIGEFDYQVVNGAKYRAIRDDEERRRQNREAKRRERMSKGSGTPLPGEERFVEADADGDIARADEIASENIPGK